MRREQVQPIALLAALMAGAAVVTALQGRYQRSLVAVVIGVVVTGLAAALLLRTGRHTPWAEASGRAGPGRAVVLWKPGCLYCERLLRALAADERVTWVNVWADEDANEVVRSLNDGDELTPTALVGDHVWRNPSPGRLRAALDPAGT